MLYLDSLDLQYQVINKTLSKLHFQLHLIAPPASSVDLRQPAFPSSSKIPQVFPSQAQLIFKLVFSRNFVQTLQFCFLWTDYNDEHQMP